MFVLTLLSFPSASKEKKSCKEIIATLTEQKEENSFAEINFTSNNLDRDFEAALIYILQVLQNKHIISEMVYL